MRLLDTEGRLPVLAKHVVSHLVEIAEKVSWNFATIEHGDCVGVLKD